jgi:hypothetical protein
MKKSEIIEKIAEKELDLNQFVQLVINDENARNEVVRQMLTNPAIMVYYHCYYIVNKASQSYPEMFYPYWNDFAVLLQHENSYHRDFGLELIGNLTKVDNDNQFSEIDNQFFSLINDEKFMTGNYCVKNLLKIYQHKDDQRKRILETLLEIDNRCDYTEKQKGVLKADVLEIFDVIYDDVQEREDIRKFIREQANSISPKTRKMAKVLIKKYRL